MKRISSIPKLGPILSISFGVITGIAYGAGARLLMGSSQLGNVFGTLSLGFLVLVPLGIGALSQYFAASRSKLSWKHAIFAPWIPTGICMLIAGIFLWEAWFCIVLAAPIFLALSSAGGCLVCFLFRERGLPGESHLPVLVIILLAPILLTPLEDKLPPPTSLRKIESQIEISASRETVWRNIIRFQRAAPAELRPSISHTLGLPRPLEATLTFEGVGGIRRGLWEDGLAFDGTITEWKPNTGYTLLLHADTHAVRPSAVPLEAIGGPYFDMVDDSYAIEPASAGRVILRLSSTYRLTTHLNQYATVWFDGLLRDIQNYILESEKIRCEADSP